MRFTTLLLITALAATNARADFLSGATGFTTLKNSQTGEKLPGIINFAVLDQKGGAYGDTWGTRMENLDLAFARGNDASNNTSPRLDTSARYLYVYQVANDGKEVPFDRASITLVISPSYITSWGHFRNSTFADQKPGTHGWTEVSATNTFGMLDPTAAPGQPSMIVYYPRVIDASKSHDLTINPLEVLLAHKAVRASWVGAAELLSPGRRSSLFGFTSNYPPTFMPGNVVYQCGHVGQPPCPK